jgi:peptidoglycan/xylan/chitin deacetylase (PgdA/CDA1 family)
MTEGAERPVRRRPQQRVRFTRRFYIALAALAALILLIVLIATLSSGGGSDGDFEDAISMVGGLNEGELHSLKVNELGAVMVLEYHRISEEGRWSRTPENFRADLEFLYNEGYRCVGLDDYVTNNIDVAAGHTPVILTFDDSDPSQFRYIEQDGQMGIDPSCAMGVMEQFDAEYADFNITATFYVLPVLFGQDEYIEQKLTYLVQNGYDIGNHTVNHPSLGDVSDQTVLEELTGNISLVREYLPGYEEKSIALPNGSELQNPSLLTTGSLNGIEVRLDASLLVGANPASAPCDYSFDPLRLPRVQALDPSLDTGDSGIYAWIQYFMENPERRYCSDGNVDTVTVPKHMIDRIDQSKLGDKELKAY